jgi:cobalt-zinc-cadmium efflux system protein
VCLAESEVFVVIDAPALRARKPVSGWTAPIDLQTMSRYQSVYWRAWILSLLIMVMELAGSIVSGSFALRADVWHMAGDMLVAFAPVAATYARGRRLNPQKIVLFGGAAVGMVLMAIGVLLLEEAVHNVTSPIPAHEVHGWLLSGFALLSAVGNWWQHRFLSQVQVPHRDLTHVGFHFHVRMDFLKNLALPVLGALLAWQLVPQRADSWAAGCIGAWIAARGVVLLARSAMTIRRAKRDTLAA